MRKKNKSFYFISILSIGFFAKFISLFSKIILTRELGVEALGLFSLVNPILVFIITLSSFSLPNALSTLISKYPNKEKKIFLSALFIVCFFSIILMILLLLLSKDISIYLLHNYDTIYCLYASIILVPLTTISAIIKGYFLGKGEVKITSLSQIFEESGRLLFIITIFSLIGEVDIPYKASIGVYSLAFGEIFQIGANLSFCSFSSRRDFVNNFNKVTLINKEETKLLMNISLPLTSSRIIGSLTYCLEPIIFSYIMMKSGFTNNEIAKEYGIISGYVLSLLIMPGFISYTLSNYLIPNMGSLLAKKKNKEAIKLFYKITLLCFILGLLVSIIFFFFGDIFLKIVFGNTLGHKYLKIFSLPFVIYYIETPISVALNMFSLSKKSLISTFISSLIRIVFLIIFVLLFKTIGIGIATMISIYIDVLMNLFFIYKFIKRNNI